MGSSRTSKTISPSVDDLSCVPSSPISQAPASAIFLFSCAFVFMIGEQDASAAWTMGAAGSIAAGALIVGLSGIYARSLSIIFAIACSCVICAISISARFFYVPALPGSLDTIGEITEVREMGSRYVYLVDTELGSSRFVVETRRDGSDPLSLGDIVALSGEPVHFERSSKGGFDEFLFWRTRGADAKIARPDLIVIGRARSFASYRSFLTQHAMDVLPRRTAGYFTAMITGERDPRLSSLHRAAGTSHLLAVSGFHVGVVFAICFAVFSRTFGRSLIISAIIWLYVMSTGASISALRAGLMLEIIIIGRALGRSDSVFNTACFAGSIMLAVDPFMFWDIGWRLSMTAVMTVCAVGRLKIHRYVKILAAPLFVWIITAPLTADVFGSAPAAGIIMNFFAIPVFSVLYPLTLIFSLPALFSLPASGALAEIPERIFAMWEMFSTNIVYLVPCSVQSSHALRALASVSGAVLFARAAGISLIRSIMIAASLLLFCARAGF